MHYLNLANVFYLYHGQLSMHKMKFHKNWLWKHIS